MGESVYLEVLFTQVLPFYPGRTVSIDWKAQPSRHFCS